MGKWAGVVMCLCLAALFLASIRWYVAWCPDGNYGIMVFGGRAYFGHVVGVHMRSLPPGWSLVLRDENWWMQWWPDFRIERWGSHSFAVSLWWPFVLAAAATGVLRHLDRRRPPGACSACAYDLTGSTTGVCPECGKACGVKPDTAPHTANL